MEIRGKVAVITGAGSGIGRATSLRLANDGASILVADVDEAGGAETVKQIEKDGGRALFVRADVTIEADARKMIDAAVEKLGGLDILYNNAGVGTGVPPFPEASLPQWRRVIDIDLTAVIMGTWIAAPIMQKRGGGTIVNTASMAGLYPHRQDPIYGAAKGGVVHFTHSCASWASEKKIRVNCVAPGAVNTPMLWNNPNIKSGKEKPGGAIGQPADIAAAICFVASDAARFINGTTVVADGARLDIL